MLKERVFKIISQVMHVSFDEISENSSPENIGKWDSFQHINLILALEDEFKIKFNDEEIMQLGGNTGTILEILNKKGVNL